jgi:hypothetical protein
MDVSDRPINHSLTPKNKTYKLSAISILRFSRKPWSSQSGCRGAKPLIIFCDEYLQERIMKYK